MFQLLAHASVGNWNNNADNCRVANRNNNNPTNSNNNIGFRPLLPVSSEQQSMKSQNSR
jgi:formylglycine-generating enzyme required for sulfatase activity